MTTTLSNSSLLSCQILSHRPLTDYSLLIPVGISPGNETAITVTGLKPCHFYNLRVIAVGPNNFRAGSPFIRLQTFGKDGRPLLGDSRLPASFLDPNQPHGEAAGAKMASEKPPPLGPAVETAPALDDSSTASRDSVLPALSSQRRNTLHRRRSPSVASTDQLPLRTASLQQEPELSLADLNKRFEGIRKEIDLTLALYARDEADAQHQEAELKKDKDRKRLLLKEKEDHTTQLKTTARLTMEQARLAEKERAKKEQQLRDKELQRTKIRDGSTKLETDALEMHKERQGFEAQKLALAEQRDRDVLRLDQDQAQLRENTAQLEAELKDKGMLLQDLRSARTKQTGGPDDDQYRQDDLRLRREWDYKRRELHNRLVAETKSGHVLLQQIRALGEQLAANKHQTGLAFYNGQYFPPNLDFESPPGAPPRHLSRAGNSMSINQAIPSTDRIESNLQGSKAFPTAAFTPGPFAEMATDDAAAGPIPAGGALRGASGPLSPSAQTLLPSNIFEESEEAGGAALKSPFAPNVLTLADDGPQSPASSTLSFKAVSSPLGSALSLSLGPSAVEGGRESLNLNSPATATSASGHKFTNFLSTFQRGRGAKASVDMGGPPIGSLKPGQSQSFPTGAEENEILAGRRRLNFSSWMGRNSVGPDSVPVDSLMAATKPFSVRGLEPPKVGLLPDRDNGSRPTSIASADLVRPSTEGGTVVWGFPAEGQTLTKTRFWSPGDGRWPSRNGSRRESLQGSNALTTTLASAEDEILDEDDLLNPETLPSQVGVIGSRPPASTSSSSSSKAIGQRLNPAAPTFMAHIFRKDREGVKEAMAKTKEREVSSVDVLPALEGSPPGSRRSRDTHSVRTEASLSGSHESLPLESVAAAAATATTMTTTTTTSNQSAESHTATAPNVKDAEKVVRKLFRKGSSGKFSLSSRLGKDSGLFKKSPAGGAAGDKSYGVEMRPAGRELEVDEGEEEAMAGRGHDSVAGSPSSLGPSRTREGRITSWRFSVSSMKRRSRETPAKEKESSLEMGRAAEED